MVDADRVILGDPALRAVMIANAAEMYRQGSGGIYDEALCMARPWGFPIEGVSVPVRIWHGALDRAVPVGMGRYIERTIPGAIATFYPRRATTWSTTVGARSSASSSPRRAPAPRGRTSASERRAWLIGTSSSPADPRVPGRRPRGAPLGAAPPALTRSDRSRR